MREENRLLKEAIGSTKAKKGFNKTNSEQSEPTDIDTESQVPKRAKGAKKEKGQGKKAKDFESFDNGNRRDGQAQDENIGTH